MQVGPLQRSSAARAVIGPTAAPARAYVSTAAQTAGACARRDRR